MYQIPPKVKLVYFMPKFHVSIIFALPAFPNSMFSKANDILAIFQEGNVEGYKIANTQENIMNLILPRRRH